MGSADPFGKTDSLDEAVLDALVIRFEARGKHPRFSKMLHEYLDAMRLENARAVLDLGCGTGLAARAIASRPAFSGRVEGIDLSAHLIRAAERLAREEGLADRIAFRTGDVRELDFADAAFDALVAHTLLSHVDDPSRVLAESARVLRPGGVIGIFDGDYASLTFAQDDPNQAKLDDEAVISAIVAQPRVMRQMPRLLQAAGFELVTSMPYVLSEVGTASFWSSAIDTYRKLIPKGGTMSEAEADAWAAALHRDSEAGVFFASANYYAYVARKRT